MSRVYQFHVLDCCIGWGKIETSSAIKQHINKFGVRGIAIASIHIYNKFEKIRDIIRPIHFEIYARGKHVGNIKREVRILKERCLCTTSYVPYKEMPSITIKANLEEKFHCHKIFTPEYYTSQAIGPARMILGQDKPYYSNLKLEFGQYCQLYENNRNNMTPRSVDGIALRPKNDRGSYFLCNLR